MNLESIKSGFYEYLLGLVEKEGDEHNCRYENIDFSEVSIFLYAKEFKDYIQDEYNISASDLSKGINDILNMEVVNGKLVDPEEEAKKKDEQTNVLNENENDGESSYISLENEEMPIALGENGQEPVLPIDGAESLSEGALPAGDTPDANGEVLTGEENSKQVTLIELFNAFLEDKDFANAVDADLNGEFTKDEIMEFFGHINSIDGNEEELSFDDLIYGANDIATHNLEQEISDNIENANTEKPDTYVGKLVNAFGGGGGGAVTQKEKTLENMTREELKAELAKDEKELSANQEELTNAISGNTPELLKLQENVENTYETYLDELELVDKDMAEKLDNAVKDIEAKEGEITDKELEIADQENTVSDAEGNYNNAVSTREALENQLELLTTADSQETDETKKAEIQNAIASVNEQITKAKTAEDEAKKAWDDEKDKLDVLNQEKTSLEGELVELENAKQEIELQIDEMYPQLEEYKNAYNDAKTLYDDKKTEAINNAKAKVEASQTEVNNDKAALNDRDNKDLAKENLKSISGFSQYNEEKGRALAATALRLYGNDHVANGNCAGGVADIIQATLGYRTHGNGCDYATELANYPNDWLNVTDEIHSVEDLKNLPAGAVVSWSTYQAGHTPSNGRYGHCWMSDGNGNEVSDFIASVNTRYADWGATFTVYIPI